MKKLAVILMLSATLGTMPAAHSVTATAEPAKPVLMAYYLLEKSQINRYPGPYEAGLFKLPSPRQLRVLTHLNLAFIDLNENGECDWEAGVQADKTGQIVEKLRQLRRVNPQLRLLVSLGGWSATNDDSTTVQRYRQAAASEAGRQRLAASCLAFIERYKLDGLDIDWEYPRSEDADAFAQLLRTLRAGLAQASKQRRTPYQLTIAAAGGAFNLLRTYQRLPDIAAQVDYLNLMTYDFHGPWDSMTNHHAHLYGDPQEALFDNPLPGPQAPARFALTADAAVQQYLDAGVPARKLVLGVPFYGRAFFHTGVENRGLFQPFSTQAGDHYSGDIRLLPGCISCLQLKDPRTPSYADIRHMLAQPLGYERHQSDASKAVWLFQPERGIFVSYEDPWSLRFKVRYAQQQGLGGMMFWHLGQDDPQDSLLLNLRRFMQQPLPAAEDEQVKGLRYHR